MIKGNQYGNDAFLRSVALPERTKSYTPITHGDIIDKVDAELSNAGFVVEKKEYLYSFGGDVAIGKVFIRSTKDPDMGMLFSWSNSYNKKVKFSCGIGAFVYENKTTFFGTDGLSWIRKHTGTADNEAFSIIEQIVDNAEEHFDNIISEKNRMKAQIMNIVSYGKVMGALYFEHGLLKPTQVTAIDREYKTEKSNYNDNDTLWGLYKMIMYGIEGLDITKWQKSQQKLHHMIMTEYAIAHEYVVNPILEALDMPKETEIDMGVDGEPVFSIQAELVDIDPPYEPNELREGAKPDYMPPHIQELAKKQAESETPEIHIESDIEYQERVVGIEAEEVLDDRQDWADKVLAEDNSEDDHVGPPEMYQGDGETINMDFDEGAVTVEVEENEIIETINNEEFEEVTPVINLPEENNHQDALDKASEEGSEELMLPEDKSNEQPVQDATQEDEDPFAIDEPDFLDITEHEGLETPTELIAEAAIIEKKMATLYGAVKPYTVANTPTQTNITIDETHESFYISIS